MYSTVDGGLSDDICTCDCGRGQEAQKQKPQQKTKQPKKRQKTTPRKKQNQKTPPKRQKLTKMPKTGKCTDTHMQIPCKNCPKTAILQDIRAT